MNKGMIMEIQRFCLQDGPGIRTTVFFKGCNMRCVWCHNPESMDREPTLMYSEEKCSECRKCLSVCTKGVHSFREGRHCLDRSACIHCGKCIEACGCQALWLIGRLAGADEIMEEIRKDQNYYRSSGGGVTFSGGEASLQNDFLLSLLMQCKKEGIHTALETNGLLTELQLRDLCRVTDLFLLDYKATGARHKELTGVPVVPVLKTLKTLQKLGASVVLRCPMIPGINDKEKHFQAIRQLRTHFSCIQEVEIMAYHDIGKGKWQECGKACSLSDLKTVSKEQKRVWEQTVSKEEQNNEK